MKMLSNRAISIAAIVISLFSVLFSFLQAQTAEQQLQLTAQQLRPHITYTPTFFPLEEGLRIDMYLQNEGSLPANVLFTDVSASVNGENINEHFYSLQPDIIYPGKDGGSQLPLFSGIHYADVVLGKSTLMLATCSIYTSTDRNDQRRWQINAINAYNPGSSLPRRWGIEEKEVFKSIGKCDAKIIMTELNSRQQIDYFGESDVVSKP